MLSKMITRRQKSASDVEGAIQHHGPKAATLAGHFLGQYLQEGETLPDLELLQRLYGRALSDHHTRIVTIDESRIAGLRRTMGPRDRRDAAAREVGDELLLLRDTFDRFFGSKATKQLLAIEAPFDRDPVSLSRLARRAVGVLRSDSLELPPSRVPVSPDLSRWASQLEDPLQKLDAALAEIQKERRGAEDMLEEKHDAIEAYDRLFLRIARMQEAFFRFAGMEGHANRVRPSARRPGLTLEEAGSERASPPPDEPES